MRASKLASKIHKWLALLIGAQLILWFASGWFMSFFPIAEVRGEHLAREQAPVVMDSAALGGPLARTLAAAGPATRIEVRSLLGRPVVHIENAEARPRLYDLADGRLLSPLPPSAATAIALADYAGTGQPGAPRLVAIESTEYRGPLPAWRVGFSDDNGTAIYVAADTGKVAARRTDLWRAYDFLWGLHIMDWTGHENINFPWLWATAAASLAMALAGVILFPSRFGWGRKRRRMPRLTRG